MDITRDADVAAAIAATVERFGRLDILFNAAGGTPEGDGPVTDVALEVFERGINVDLRGTCRPSARSTARDRKPAWRRQHRR